MIPAMELARGIVVFPRIQVSQQSGGGEAAGTQVEDEVDQSVELTLAQWHVDEPGYSVLGEGDIRFENGFGLLKGNAVGIAFSS